MKKYKQQINFMALTIKDEDKHTAMIRNMASSILSIMLSKGRCMPTDLFASGFAPTEVTQHWHLAHSVAAVESNLFRRW